MLSRVLNLFKRKKKQELRIKKKEKKQRLRQKKARKQEKAQHRIEGLRRKLYHMGFTQKALSDLERFAQDDSRPYLQKLAAWELALWYVSKKDAQQCLRFLPVAISKEKKGRLRQALILEAECLGLLGKREAAKSALHSAFAAKPHADYCFAAANMEDSYSKRQDWMNAALTLHQRSEIIIDSSASSVSFPSLHSKGTDDTSLPAELATLPTISVILPVYNGEKTLPRSLQSLLHQSWPNLEILVVDDCSTDQTVTIIKQLMHKDNRVRLLQAEGNGGMYVARNLALAEACGEYVTCHNAGEWAHPVKLESQALHLINNPAVMANTSQHVYATPDLEFYRSDNAAKYLDVNLSSLMFRRSPVMAAIGYYDSVCHGGEMEYILRAKKVLGDEAVVDVKTGPLSFAAPKAYSQSQLGAKREYLQSLHYFHHALPSLRFDFPSQTRPFPAPQPILPLPTTTDSVRRHFDVIIASDFRLPAGTTMSNVEEIKAQRRLGLQTGLVQMSRYNLNPYREMNPRIRQLQDGHRVHVIAQGEEVSCDLLIIKYPPILQYTQDDLPKIHAKEIRVVANQTPMSEYGPKGVFCYDIRDCAQHVQAYFGKSATWHPIGPLIRETIHRYHAHELVNTPLADEDWVEIIDLAEWRREARPEKSKKIRVGRHSREQYVKWPSDPAELLSIYPPDDDYEILVLGGAMTPLNVLGRLPDNWHVLEFGAVHPKDFLAQLDVFVYFIHPDLVEAFGRVILEAMAVGVPVILPHKFSDLFGDAAIYALPSEVQLKIQELMNDDHHYSQQVEKALAYVERHFGYSQYVQRLLKIADEQNLPMIKKLKSARLEQKNEK